MGKSKEDKSDDIEIISIGNLYSGPWDKKYWSSSRGKDRYPYPVGYKSVRTLSGVTYKMEILEGLKGPSFTINSSDGKSCSGETPDIAWESFQKKGCPGIKLWHGKRFSCKIGGVQFFGFKNAFVQRLLRELVANIGENVQQSFLEQNSLTSNLSTGVTVKKLQGQESRPGLVSFLGGQRITGKRTRNNKMVKTGQKSHPKQYQHEKATENASGLSSTHRDKSVHAIGDSSTSAAANSLSLISNSGVLDKGNMESVVEFDKSLTVTETGRQVDYSDNSHHLENDGSRTAEVHGLISEEKNVLTNAQHGKQMVNHAALCIPDTLDNLIDSCPVTSPSKHVPSDMEDAISNDVLSSETSMIDSHPEDGIDPSTSNTFSEKSDNSLAGQEIAQAMMTVLLPRALPLLKTFSRKKKKNAIPSKNTIHRSEEKTNISNACIHDASRDLLPEHLKLEGQNEKAYIPGGSDDSVVSTLQNTASVVPDSFDSVDPQDLNPCTAIENQMPYGLDTHVQPGLIAACEKISVVSHNETGRRDLNIDSQTQTISLEEPQKVSVLAVDKDIIPNPKRARINGHSMVERPTLQASRAKHIPGSDITNSRTSTEKRGNTFCCSVRVNDGLKDGSRLSNQRQLNSNSQTSDVLELSACYVLPMPISMVQLIVKGNDVYICVKCGYLEQKESTLFAYKASRRGENVGCPSLIGHVPMAFQSSTNAASSDIIGDSSVLQFTPDAQFLAVNNITVPYCREGKLGCLCPACSSDCFEKNVIKIVQLNSGYVSLVTRLETTEDVSCFLVCGPNFLLAAEESGKLKLWVMNSGWSAEKEHWYLPSLDCTFPCLVELKRIPQSASLIVGHNGIGEFGLWDIDNRSLLSRFSSSGMPVFRCIPAGMFRWQGKMEHKMKEHIDEILDATRSYFTRKGKHDTFSEENKDVAVWLLISTISDQDSQHHHQSCEGKAKRVRCWRLALLVNNMLIRGSAIDSGAAAIISLGHGVIGRSDGLVYVWELSTGAKLRTLHSFKGTGVSCVTSDPMNSDALAVAGGDQLQIYLPS